MDVELSISPFTIFNYHYNCDNIKDIGWGCVYRNIQTMFSYLNCFLFPIKVPSIIKIMKFFNKPTYGNGLNMWIEPHQAKEFFKSYLLEYEKLHKLELVEILWVKNNESINQIEFTPLEVYTTSPNLIFATDKKINELLDLLRINLKNKIPILIDNGTYSYLIKSIDEKNNGIIIDPHCTEHARILEKDLSTWLTNSSCWMIFFIKN